MLLFIKNKCEYKNKEKKTSQKDSKLKSAPSGHRHSVSRGFSSSGHVVAGRRKESGGPSENRRVY